LDQGGVTMKCIGVIPARFGSTRFPGKPLAPIQGKPMLAWVIEGARQSRLVREILVATDDDRIAEVAVRLGAEVVMTSPDLPSGSDRVWAAVRDRDVDVVVNIQGDEPLLEGKLLDVLVTPLIDNKDLAMATLGRAPQTEDLSIKSTAKIVLNHRNEAIYFSRFPIPYSRVDAPRGKEICLQHIGIYAYRKSFLREFCAFGPVALEEAEGLEQLRALFLGARIQVVKVEHESWGVDTPEDVIKIERILKTKR
jgi:3-deoxy-manno-octulosonate cytidylyltransferase (CMP-KDO synthetase)